MRKFMFICLMSSLVVSTNTSCIIDNQNEWLSMTQYQQLTQEVDRIIHFYAPTSKLNAKHLVSCCIQYDIDISFVLAQALLESHFGTRGLASKTNSVWNVGSYDNGVILYTYEDPNESLIPYLQLLKKRYLVNKTTNNLMDHYVNCNGLRYASSPTYEKALTKVVKTINNHFNNNLT